MAGKPLAARPKDAGWFLSNTVKPSWLGNDTVSGKPPLEETILVEPPVEEHSTHRKRRRKCAACKRRRTFCTCDCGVERNNPATHYDQPRTTAKESYIPTTIQAQSKDNALNEKRISESRSPRRCPPNNPLHVSNSNVPTSFIAKDSTSWTEEIVTDIDRALQELSTPEKEATIKHTTTVVTEMSFCQWAGITLPKNDGRSLELVLRPKAQPKKKASTATRDSAEMSFCQWAGITLPPAPANAE